MTTIRIQVDEEALAEAEDRLGEQGLTLSDAVDSLLLFIAREGRLPFPPRERKKEDLLAELYGEKPSADTSSAMGLLEEEEENPFLSASSSHEA